MLADAIEVNGSFSDAAKIAESRTDEMLQDLRVAKEHIVATSPHLGSQYRLLLRLRLTPIVRAASTDDTGDIRLEPDTSREDTAILKNADAVVENREEHAPASWSSRTQTPQTPETADAVAMLKNCLLSALMTAGTSIQFDPLPELSPLPGCDSTAVPGCFESFYG